MAHIHLELLGGFSARHDGGAACRVPTRKAEALLAYLAVPAGRFHSRGKLAALLWGETSEAQARQSFRQALATLRRALGSGEPPALLTRGDTVALNPAAVAVDIAALEAALADASPGALAQATTLYKGDFLDGHRVDEAAFEEWRVTERERLRELALAGLTKLLRQLLDAGGHEAAISTAQRILAIDPLQEKVHRTLMRLLARRGRRAAALQQYQVCVGWLERELGAEPGEETRALYREILRAAGSAPERAAPRVSTPSGPVLSAVGVRAGEGPMIGRAVESKRLRETLTRMLDEGGRVVAVRGEAGIGKSRLLREFSIDTVARGVRIALGRCHETEQILPLYPWIEALRGGRAALDAGLCERLGAAAVAHLARVLPELQQSGDQAVTTGEQYGLLFDALLRLLRELTAEQPIVLILEDLHWADALSARFLAFLGRRIDRLPVLIVGSMRPEDLVDAPLLVQALEELRAEGKLDELALNPLSEPETQELARTLQPAAPHSPATGRIADRIWAISEGNPFVIVESVRALRDHSPDAGQDGVPVARGVRDFVAGRLGRLADLPQHVVAVAAAIGRDFPFALLTRAAQIGEADAAGAVEELVRRRVFAAVGDRLEFCHDWIQRVAYERLLPQRRSLLHAAVGDALEELYRDGLDAVADQLGHHYSRGGDARKAIAHLIRFAELAARSYALEDADRALGQAMRGVSELSLAERDRCMLDLVLRQAFVLSTLGRQREVRDLLRAHAERVDHVADPSLASEYHFRAGLTAIYLGEQAQSRLAAERALAEGERSGDPERIGKALYLLSLSAYEAGRPKHGIAHATRAIPLLRDLPSARIWLGLAYYALALTSLVAGALGAALDAAGLAEAVGRATEWPRIRALAGYVAAWALALRGDHEAAVETARRSLDLSRDPTAASLVSGSLGLAHLEGGDGGSAVAILAPVVAQLRKSPVRSGEVRHLALLGEAYLVVGDVDRARETASRALEIGHADGMIFNIGLAQRALGRVAFAEEDFAEADRRLSTALATFAACDAAFEAARTRVELARLRARLGAKDAAGEHLAASVAVFEAARAPKRAAEARALAGLLRIALVEV
jgi:DNA-binding SARP family transcriptional activator